MALTGIQLHKYHTTLKGTDTEEDPEGEINDEEDPENRDAIEVVREVRSLQPSGFPFSDEQKVIAYTLKEGRNVIVDSVAGSGKTTTIRCIAEALSSTRILAVLYNRALADESQAKLSGGNVEVRTIHSAAANCYKVQCMDDRGIQSILSTNAAYFGTQYDIVIVDEAQDLTPNLVRIIRKILRDCRAKQMVAMGDYMQSIYAFNEADERFLTMADTFFSDYLPPNTWVRLSLSQTFRCPRPIVNFINTCLLDNSRLVSSKPGVKPKYIVCNAFESGPDIDHEINLYLSQGNSLEDVAILAFSISGYKSPIARVANYLTQVGKPIFRPHNDYASIRDDRLLKGKIVVSTFHQFKGRERKLIIVMGFDDGFYFCNKDAPRDACPNLIYVAVTRSLDRLILVNHNANGALPFLNLDYLSELAELSGTFPRFGGKTRVRPKNYSTSDLVKFLPNSFMESIQSLWTITTVAQPDKGTEIETIVPFQNTSEDVSAIYGTAVPVIKQWKLQGRLILFEAITNLRGYATTLGLEPQVIQVEQVKQMYMNGYTLSWSQLAWLINLYNCILDRYVYPLKQITNYDWFEANLTRIEECTKRLDFLTSRDLFEVLLDYQTKIGPTAVSVLGAIDCFHNDQIWEFKSVREFKDSHILQIVLYACMWYVKTRMMKDAFLCNIRTGETLQIKIEPKNARIILDRVIGHKLRSGDHRKTLPELLSL